ncbi:hypothetical protein DPMN_061399 [Dreissena polymorpha]|uniref:Uncharacterized protein n=1 Tax=Dreissena polymorpha TaxID=45954 RepID=A0A9D4HIE9_DREPO|nr:hypothetical protein DPMN_061399 [Dreissena polymorpha]
MTVCQNDISDDLDSLQNSQNDLDKKIKKLESDNLHGNVKKSLENLKRYLERGKESKTYCEKIQTTLLKNESLTIGDILGHTIQNASSLERVQLGSLLITKVDQLHYSADNPTQGISSNDELSPTTAVTASKYNKYSTKSTVNTRRSSTLLTSERSPIQSKSPQNRSGSSKTNFRKSTASVGNMQTPHFAKSPVVKADDCPMILFKRVSLQSDNLPINITSSAFLEDGVIVLCDTTNKKLLLRSLYKDYNKHKMFSSTLHNVARIPGYGVAVTFPDLQIIQYIPVTKGDFGEVGNQVETKSNCKAVCLNKNGNLIYASRNDVDIVEMS